MLAFLRRLSGFISLKKHSHSCKLVKWVKVQRARCYKIGFFTRFFRLSFKQYCFFIFSSNKYLLALNFCVLGSSFHLKVIWESKDRRRPWSQLAHTQLHLPLSHYTLSGPPLENFIYFSIKKF